METANQSLLGKKTVYKSEYDSGLLFPIPRLENRKKLELTDVLPFQGFDVWNLFELSWLDSNGKPHIATAELSVPSNSLCIIESKSLKLYLNSFNQTQFDSLDKVTQTITEDLSKACESQIQLDVYENHYPYPISDLHGTCLDSLPIETNCYDINPSFLKAEGPQVTETLYSHLFRSNCLCTGQPDWASISISYRGSTIDREGLLKYLISYRGHQAFHEYCIEHIFVDIMNRCHPERLTVDAHFTRRGGLDIRPFRSNFESKPKSKRLFRQ